MILWDFYKRNRQCLGLKAGGISTLDVQEESVTINYNQWKKLVLFYICQGGYTIWEIWQLGYEFVVIFFLNLEGKWRRYERLELYRNIMCVDLGTYNLNWCKDEGLRESRREQPRHVLYSCDWDRSLWYFLLSFRDKIMILMVGSCW